ncbi:unnamed protein product [Rotaria magnacalcarata]|uniref:Lipase domain-containing protein n=2 Tax=Rotaria magnacalcarata TaxID=392030 RepID=A0A816T3K9_9BILA|nr:unnamed protein product [Rotaria magnacalcarata]CAF1242585.1 unnamed protein product [Rotaria magnacalcarata]CAF2091485.1 unnamed protein product [Rotaria magnacalcarata]CAF4061732.1 unnamed protein product [Rotaria magnacalcarata]CAF4263728.1 unnamed protein product [Rotaria magnacalcarata]
MTLLSFPSVTDADLNPSIDNTINTSTSMIAIVNMRFQANFQCVFIPLLILSIDGRLVPSQHEVNEPLTIDTLSAGNSLQVLNRQTRAPVANTTVCYPVVGCFDNNEPFNNAGLEVPQSPEFIDTAFLLFTQESQTDPEFIVYDSDKSILNSSVSTSRWLRIIIHGFQNNRESVWIPKLRAELLKLKNDEQSDVIVVDWGNGAKFPLYPNAVANIRLVGRQVGLLLKKLHDLKGISYDRMHCIGHSLGAHACGFTSNAVENQLARISGLDPAGPFFAGKKTIVRLDKDDAKFVDVIHSNTEIALGLGLGITEETGHIDFYPNGGQTQPGCPSIGALIGGVLGGQSEAAFEQTSCSHGRSHGYFIESINSECPYTAFPCHDHESFMNGKCLVCPISGCAQMGFYSIYSLGRGKMYLTTRSNSPFCGYHYFVELVLDRDMAKTSGEIYVAVYSNYELLANVSLTERSNADIKAGDILRHVFSYHTDLGKVDYVMIYFQKAKAIFGWGGQKGDEILVSRLRLKSLEDTVIYSGLCETTTKVAAYSTETLLLNRFDCDD